MGDRKLSNIMIIMSKEGSKLSYTLDTIEDKQDLDLLFKASVDENGEDILRFKVIPVDIATKLESVNEVSILSELPYASKQELLQHFSSLF